MSLSVQWGAVWEGPGWGPAWKGAFEGLSAAQAAWVPEGVPGAGSDRAHSIWQILNHMVFWREVVVAGLRGERPSDDETARRNWEAPAYDAVTERAWEDAKAYYAASHELVADAIASSEDRAKKLAEMLPHDAYHIGQVYTMRALLGV